MGHGSLVLYAALHGHSIAPAGSCINPCYSQLGRPSDLHLEAVIAWALHVRLAMHQLLGDSDFLDMVGGRHGLVADAVVAHIHAPERSSD